MNKIGALGTGRQRLRGDSSRCPGAMSVPQTRRVLMVAYDFPPSADIGAQANAQIARYLPLYGWEPVVLTVRERFVERLDAASESSVPGTVIRTGMLPHPLTIFRGLKAWFRPPVDTPKEAHGDVESFEEARVVRRWVLSLLAVPDVYTGWGVPAITAGRRAIRRLRVNHVFSSGPCWTNHLVGLTLAQLTGLPWTAHFRDPWVAVHSRKPVSVASSRIETGLAKMVVKRADVVVCVTEQHSALLRQSDPALPSDKFVTIPNGYDGAEWDDVLVAGNRATPSTRDTFVVTFAGSLYHELTPLPLFQALKRLIDSREVDQERIRVNLFGWCNLARGRRVTDLAIDCGIGECVTVRGPLSRAETIRQLANSDLLLVLIRGSLQIPGKTYEYLRAGRPILALTSEGALADLLRKTGGAWVIDPEDTTGVAGAVLEAYRRWRDGHPGPVANPAVVASFNRRLLTGRFAELFDRSIA